MLARLVAVGLALLPAALAQAQAPAPPAAGVPIPETPPGPVTAVPGSPPASSAVDISSTRPQSLPRTDNRPAATQVVPGPDSTASTPPSR